MPLIELDSPAQFREAFERALAVEVPLGGPGDRRRIIPTGGIFHFPVYVLSLLALADGEVAANAQKVGWGMVTRNQEGVAFSGDMPLAPEPVSSRMSGPAVESVLATYERLMVDTRRFQDDNYEPRLLRIPAVMHQIEVFWLRGTPDQRSTEQPDRDLVAVFGAFQDRLGGQPVVSMRTFLGVASRYANRRLRLTSPPD